MNDYIYWHGRKYRADKVERIKEHSFDRINKDSLKEISRKGGVASGEARRKKAELKKKAQNYINDLFIVEGYLEEDIEDFRQWQKKRKRERSGF